jgi:1-acyl-sn-glycerol-3-phosphate acyltransferase
MAASDLSRYQARTREKGVSKPLFWLARVVLGFGIQIYFSLERTGRKNIPKRGPVILAANHRSFLDPFLIGCCMRRPVYFVAKQELFKKRWQGWLLNRLGAFPIRRGEADEESMETARLVLERGGALVIFPEGTRHRHGPLARPKRGVGRLALETGAPVVPIAILGSERARRGWRIRPVWVRIRCGRPLTFPRVEKPSPRLAEEVTARLWPCVELQWEWLGGERAEPVEVMQERKAA